ncbi:MAG: PASTA domain-containing protein, partial [Spirochaetaceae bacterium]
MRRFTDTIRKMLPRYGERPESRYFKITVLSVLGIVLLTVIAGLGTFVLSLRGREEILVPEVRQAELADALIELQERELHTEVQLRYHSDPNLKGKVVDQDPAAGTLVRAGKEVALTVSRGAIVDRVGDYTGRTLQEVRSELSTMFSTFDPLLQIGDVSYVFSDEPAGTILEQDPEPETELSGTTPLDLVVSRGEDVRRISVPSYSGLDFREAIDLLAEQDIPFTFSLSDNGQSGAGGIIVDQEPEAGTSVPAGSPVHLTMMPPDDVPEAMVFGIFERVLPEYPVSVDVTLEAIDPDGERETLFSMKHPGGEIAVPYMAEENSRIVLSRFDTEVLSERVRPPDPEPEADTPQPESDEPGTDQPSDDAPGADEAD